MLKIPLFTKVDSCSDNDLEIVATLIDAICFSLEMTTMGLINPKLSNSIIKLFLNGKSIELTDLINLFENEETSFTCVPPICLPELELDLKSTNVEWSHIRQIDIKDIRESTCGLLELDKNLIPSGISSLNTLINIQKRKPKASIINLGKDFHFFTDNYKIGSLTVIN